MTYEPIIGLEIHVQLKTKLFCPCDNTGEFQPPNTTICPICLGHPGVLPVLNQQALEWAVLAALALNCQILEEARFARKNYFYPDLPKGYQISMYEEPIGINGKLVVEVPNKNKERREIEVRIARVHLEEDAAKLLHSPDGHASFIDFNRAGTPLIEIVTEPDLRSPLEAKVFLQELRRLIRYLGISDAEMENGHLRCDANISLRPVLDNPTEREICPGSRFHPKSEIKNLNSFKAVERALEYEFIRQKKLWEAGTPPLAPSTRGWDETQGITIEQRTKEGSEDYRYFPEPDLPPLKLRPLVEKISSFLPELPAAKRKRFIEEYGFGSSEAFILTEEKELANFVEETMGELEGWLRSVEGEEILGEETRIVYKKKLAKLVSNWLINKLFGLMEKHSIRLKRLRISPENFAEFITLIYQNKISSSIGLQILEEMLLTGKDPSQIIEEKQLEQISSEEEILDVAQDVIKDNPQVVKEYQKGKENVLQFLIGQVMKKTNGKANPPLAAKILRRLLKQTEEK
jgi:aspartyl-tRNA(Asn)/glutamyl-tRNA(Gln) amidotransferase subunit B